MTSLAQGFATQTRVIGALMIREIYARFGREGLSFAWVFGEPLVFALPVLLVWHAARNPFDNGLPMMPFLWSGYLPLMMFRHIGGRLISVVRQNIGVLYHRQVTIFDLSIARVMLEGVSNLAAAAISFVIFYAVGFLDAPRNPALFYLGYLYMFWWCLVVGLIVGMLSERSEWVEKVWSPISYLYMFFSGFFFLSDWLPPGLRWYALCQPSFQAYEMIRSGMFGDIITTHYDFGYTSLVLAALTVVGLWTVRAARQYTVIE